MNRRQIRIYIDHFKRKLHISDGLNFRRRRHKIQGDAVRYYLIWALQIALVVLLAFGLTAGFGKRVSCAGESMADTIPENGNVWLNRVTYHLKEPQRGDVIAFYPKGNVNANYSIKRIVAVPGDTVLIANGRLYVNEQVTRLRQEDASIQEAGRAATVITLGEDEYFVLGDNVNNSEDSRYESVGNVSRSDIVGKVWFVLSLGSFGPIQ